MNESPSSGPRLPRGIAKLAILNSLSFASFAVITPVLDRLVREPFDVGNSGTAKFMAIHGVATLIFYIVAGLYADRIGRRVPLIVVGLIGSGITTAFIPHFRNFEALLAWRFLDGIFGAVSLGLLITRALDLAGPENRNRTMGVMSIAIAAGFVASPILASTLGAYDLRILFGVVGGALALGGVWMTTDLSEPEALAPLHGGGIVESARALAAAPRLLLPIAFAFVDKFTFGTMGHLTALMVADRHGGSIEESSGAVLVFWIAYSIFCLPSGRLCDRFGSLPVMIAGSALYGAAMATMGVVGYGGFVAAMGIAGVFCALQYVPSVALVGQYAPPERRGAAMGAWNTAGSLGVVMGMAMSGKLSEIGYGLAYGVAGGLEAAIAACAWIVLLARRRRPK